MLGANPQLRVRVHGLGLIETRLSHYKEAISYYQKALETIPNYRDSVRELSDAYLKMDKRNHPQKHLKSIWPLIQTIRSSG